MTDYVKRKSIASKIMTAGAVLCVGSVGALVAGCEPSLVYITTATLGATASYIAALHKDFCESKIAYEKQPKKEDPYKGVRAALAEFLNRDEFAREDFLNKFAQNLSDPNNYPESFKKL